jgi:H+/Cl- antiporter ClcA
MHNNHHQNPSLSIILGTFFGISSYFIEHPELVDFSFDLAKVCLFGFIGGIFGFFGKKFISKFFKKSINEEIE